MRILEITRIRQPGRNAQTVADFYYRDAPPNGLRAMTAGMIRDGLILNRFVCLDDSGDTLTIFTMFSSEEARQAWRNNPVMLEVQEQWADRSWEGETEVIPCREMIDVAAWGRNG